MSRVGVIVIRSAFAFAGNVFVIAMFNNERESIP
jgi:hypothetical protein